MDARVYAGTRNQSMWNATLAAITMAVTTIAEKQSPMGIVYTDITLTNLLLGKTVHVRTMVDTGTTHMVVPAHIAREIGFDLEEMSTYSLTVADSRRIRCPRIGPIEIRLQDRTYQTEAAVLGDECLMGVIPLEAMDLVVDPCRQRVIAIQTILTDRYSSPWARLPCAAGRVNGTSIISCPNDSDPQGRWGLRGCDAAPPR